MGSSTLWGKVREKRLEKLEKCGVGNSVRAIFATSSNRRGENTRKFSDDGKESMYTDPGTFRFIPACRCADAARLDMEIILEIPKRSHGDLQQFVRLELLELY